MLPIEQLNSLSENSLNSTRQLAEVALEGQEKIVKVSMDAIQEFIKTGGQQFKESCSDIAGPHSLEAWPQVIMGNIQRNTALNLNLIEVTNRLQRELACVFEENLRALRDGTIEAVGKYADAGGTPSVPAGRRRQAAEKHEPVVQEEQISA